MLWLRPALAAARPLAQFWASAASAASQVRSGREMAPGMAFAASRAVRGRVLVSWGSWFVEEGEEGSALVVDLEGVRLVLGEV